MGLQKTVNLPTGIDVTDAYIRINHVSNIDWERLNASVTVAYYKSRDDFKSGAVRFFKEELMEITGSDFTNTLGDAALEAGGTNIRKQIYTWLKTQAQFLDAVDVLEE